MNHPDSYPKISLVKLPTFCSKKRSQSAWLLAVIQSH